MQHATDAEMIRDINSHPTARRVFGLLAHVSMALAPVPRAEATAKTFDELAALPGMDAATLTIADVVFGLTVIWSHYSVHRIEDVHPSRRARAATLREIAETLSGMAGVSPPTEDWQTSRKRCRAVWALVAGAYPGDDPRAMAIRETWGREAGFLAT